MTTDAPALEEEKQDQTVESGEAVVEGKEAGTDESVDTAATEEGTSTTDEAKEPEVDAFSIEGIGSDTEPVKTEGDVLKLEGLSSESQERVNKKIIGANNDKKTAQEETKKFKDRVLELEAEIAKNAAPTERPLAPLERNFENDGDYQKAEAKYQDDTIAYNAAVSNAKTQEVTQAERVKANDGRLVVQIDELQKKFPDIDVKAIIAAVANENGFGNAGSFIADSEHSGRIALFLAKNESERTRIGNLVDAGSINREIGKLEERFTNVRKKTTKAPESLSTIDNKSDTIVKDISKIKDDNEWYKAERAKEKAEFIAKQNAN